MPCPRQKYNPVRNAYISSRITGTGKLRGDHMPQKTVQFESAPRHDQIQSVGKSG